MTTTTTQAAPTAPKAFIPQNITIAREFATLTEAVLASGMDLSFNRPLAMEDLARMDKPDRHFVLRLAFMDDNGVVWYVVTYKPEGLDLLHCYEPFHSVLDNGPIKVYQRSGAELVHITTVTKTSGNRRAIAQSGMIAG